MSTARLSLRLTAARPGAWFAAVLLAIPSAHSHPEHPGPSALTTSHALDPAADHVATETSQADIETWTRRTREHPDDVAAWIGLGDCLMQRSRELHSHAACDSAESAYRRALELAPRHPAALLGMAWVCNSRHDFEAGGRWARQTLEVAPKTAEAFALLGDAAVEYGDYDAAFEYYQNCLDLAPNLSSYSRAAQLLWLTGDVSRAKHLMRKAIAAGSSRPEDTAWCRAELARMCLNTGSVTVAEREANTALQSAPDLPHALVVMGGVRSALADYPAAIGLYRRAVEIAPTHDALVALGDLYALTGQDAEAAKTYARLVALHKSDSQEHSHDGVRHLHIPARGNAQWARFLADHDRDLDEALAAAGAAFRSFTNVFVADTLAWCYYRKGEFDKAHQTILKALRWNTPDASIHFHAGMIAAKLGDHGFARMQLYRALNLNPHFHPKDAPLAAETLKALAAAATTARGR